MIDLSITSDTTAQMALSNAPTTMRFRTGTFTATDLRRVRSFADYMCFQVWRVGNITGAVQRACRLKGDSDTEWRPLPLPVITPQTHKVIFSVATNTDITNQNFATGDQFHYQLHEEMEYCFHRSISGAPSAGTSLHIRVFV